MMSCTSAASRPDSLCMRLANRRTASSSSAEDSSASASREMAPTGVFSSWDTLATKSLRISSVRVISVRSSASSRMYSSPSMAARTCTMMVPWPERAARAVRAASPGSRRRGGPRPSCPAAACGPRCGRGPGRRRRLPGLARTTPSTASTTTKARPTTASTSAAPGGRAGSSTSTSTSCRCCSLTRKASTPKVPNDRPTRPAMTPMSIGSTAPAYAVADGRPMPIRAFAPNGSANVHLQVRNSSPAAGRVCSWTAERRHEFRLPHGRGGFPRKGRPRA